MPIEPNNYTIESQYDSDRRELRLLACTDRDSYLVVLDDVLESQTATLTRQFASLYNL